MVCELSAQGEGLPFSLAFPGPWLSGHPEVWPGFSCVRCSGRCSTRHLGRSGVFAVGEPGKADGPEAGQEASRATSEVRVL